MMYKVTHPTMLLIFAASGWFVLGVVTVFLTAGDYVDLRDFGLSGDSTIIGWAGILIILSLLAGIQAVRDR